MSGALPPVPDLIPISVLRKGSKNCGDNCDRGEVEEVMGEQQRSRRQLQAAAASEDTSAAIDTSRSRGSSDAAPGASRKAHRKSDRRRDRDQQHHQQEQQQEHLRQGGVVRPRVNPIFVWVRQKDTEIVEVKCEDYDKRNRILLTKTAQGWRAIPRTETLAPSLSKTVEEKPKKIKRRKRKSAAVQVEIKEAEEVAAGNVNSDECSAQGAEEAPPPPTDCQNNNNKCDVTPLDNLLAVAELEFNQQQWDKKASPQQDDMEQLDMFIESCAPDEEKDKTVSECDYNEEDDNNLAMDDILSRLEQSLRSPDTLNEIIQPVQIEDKQQQKEPQEAPTDLSLTTTYDELPTDLSVPKCQSPPKRPPSQNSETIQSPQPSGIPAVSQSPDLYSAKKSVYLESMLSPMKPPEKEPLDLGKSRESDSPKVTCSQEVQPPKKIKLEDITLKTLLDNEVKEKQDPKTPRLLELLTNEVDPDPVVQLKQLLAGNLNIPDPMLIPKDRLSLILSSPFKEIPKLLTQRPELRLPEALAYPHLLQDPDILVITLAQLETIVQKQNQTLPLIDTTKLDEAAKEKPKPQPVAAAQPTQKKPPQKISELSTDIDAATNAAFTQMMWLPYLNQLEAMSFGNNADFLKIISTMLPSYPPEMSHMRLPFPPPMPMQPPLNYNPLELSMWQEAMLTRNYPKFGKNPYFLPPPQRPNLQIPQYKYPNKQKSPTYPKAPYIYQQRKAELKQQELKAQQAKQQQQELKQAEFIKQQELLYLTKPKVACKPFANLAAAAAQHQQQQQEKRFASRVPAPMDLSGATTTSTTSSSKLKVKHNLVDHSSAPRLLNREDVPEVGSTTASIEEMQDAQKHLWHPLFGNQKSYSSPWNWTTVTATGE